MSEDILSICEVRDYKIEDKSFILATFLRGLYYGNEFFNIIPKDIFMDNYKRVAEALIDNPRNVVKIACLKEDPDVILGYSILSGDYQTIHWIFVKKLWRNKGISKILLPQFPIAITHFTTLGLGLLPKFKECVFDPFRL